VRFVFEMAILSGATSYHALQLNSMQHFPSLLIGKSLFSLHACKTNSLFRLSYLTDPPPFVACMQKIDDFQQTKGHGTTS
jgi:hypothetical protein